MKLKLRRWEYGVHIKSRGAGTLYHDIVSRGADSLYHDELISTQVYGRTFLYRTAKFYAGLVVPRAEFTYVKAEPFVRRVE